MSNAVSLGKIGAYAVNEFVKQSSDGSRIFPRGGVNPPGGGVNTQFCPKTA